MENIYKHGRSFNLTDIFAMIPPSRYNLYAALYFLMLIVTSFVLRIIFSENQNIPVEDFDENAWGK